MSLPLEANVNQLKPFAKVLLNPKEKRTLFNLIPDNPDANYLHWESITQDIWVFSNIMRIMAQTATFSDEKYLSEPYHEVTSFMMKSEIFKRLDSSDIVVTKGHSGTTPSFHIGQVSQNLITDPLAPPYRVMERLSGAYHDVGKMVSAGIDRATVTTMMEENKHPKHSHPNHDKISTLVLQTLGQHPHVQEIAQNIHPHFWPQLIFLVLHHHIYEDIKVLRPEDEKPTIIFPQETLDLAESDPLLAFLIFTFSHADMNSNPKYHQYWPDKVYAFAHFMQKTWPGVGNVLNLLPWFHSARSHVALGSSNS